MGPGAIRIATGRGPRAAGAARNVVSSPGEIDGTRWSGPCGTPNDDAERPVVQVAFVFVNMARRSAYRSPRSRGATLPFPERLRRGEPPKREPGDREEAGVLVVSVLARAVGQSPTQATHCWGGARHHVHAGDEPAACRAAQKQASNRHTALARTSNPIHSTLVPTVHRASPRRPGRTWRTPSRRRLRVYLFCGQNEKALVRPEPVVVPTGRLDTPLAPTHAVRVEDVGHPEAYRYRKQRVLPVPPVESGFWSGARGPSLPLGHSTSDGAGG